MDWSEHNSGKDGAAKRKRGVGSKNGPRCFPGKKEEREQLVLFRSWPSKNKTEISMTASDGSVA